MKIFARRIEAPTVQNRYATKWQIVVERAGQLEFFDRVTVRGGLTFRINEESQPAIWGTPSDAATVEGIRNVDGVDQWTRLQ